MLGYLKHKTNKLVKMALFRMGIDTPGAYLTIAETIPGWVTWQELAEKIRCCQLLPRDAQIVEIGAFLGRSTVVLAGARKLKGSGMVHSIDPFDASGENFSAGIYKEIENGLKSSLLDTFRQNLSRARVSDYVRVHKGTAESVVSGWQTPIDMLILDGDQSPEGALAAYKAWIPFLKPGGILILHNSGKRVYEEGHDGHRQLALKFLKEPEYVEIHTERMTTFAKKAEHKVEQSLR